EVAAGPRQVQQLEGRPGIDPDPQWLLRPVQAGEVGRQEERQKDRKKRRSPHDLPLLAHPSLRSILSVKSPAPAPAIGRRRPGTHRIKVRVRGGGVKPGAATTSVRKVDIGPPPEPAQSTQGPPDNLLIPREMLRRCSQSLYWAR